MVPPAVLEELAGANLEKANRLSDLVLPAYQVGNECRGVWQMRHEQLAEDTGSAPWVTRFVVETATASVVGRAGFHGPPDARGMVEVGYAIDPPHRRQGHARSSLEILLGIAASHRDVTTVRASISPANRASRALVEHYGFLEVGEQWDEEDGPEIIFELPAGSGSPRCGAQRPSVHRTSQE
jgi:RimJ/RimL family protein N-acetyltransferase